MIEFRFESPHSAWAPLYVFNGFFENFQQENPSLDISFVNSASSMHRSPCGIDSAHIMTITNKVNGKYLIVSYWDHPIDYTKPFHGWQVENCVEIISSSGSKPEYSFTPFSYLPYSIKFDQLSENSCPLVDKKNNKLFFRGYLYGQRLNLHNVDPSIISDQKLFPEEKYFNELNNNKINLSLNGAGEICNRDFEILSSRSVLLRPKLELEFHNKLIPNYHYVTYEPDPNPKFEMDSIKETFNRIKDDTEFLTFISENGYSWFKENGTVKSNIEILKKIINIDKLN